MFYGCREELLATLAAVADFAYGWGLLDAYVARLQAEVCRPFQANPSLEWLQLGLNVMYIVCTGSSR